MRNRQFKLSYVIVIILIGALVFGLGFTSYRRRVPQEIYQVYIDGKVVGFVEDDKAFDEYINQKEDAIKKKYGVDKVYMPNGVTIKAVTTYNSNIDTNEEIYQRIVKLKQFTILGTVIKISNEEQEDYEDKYIYTLNKDIFDKAVDGLIRSFVDEEDYEAYMANAQKEIVDTGSIINDIDIDEDITYKTAYISIDEEIFTNSSDLAKYLLYGTIEQQSTYVVKDGDTIETVADANKLNVQEFLIANSNFKSANALLYEGQKVNVGLINPVISIVVEMNKVTDEEKAFETTVKYDSNEPKGVEYVTQKGENGLERVSREYVYINGQLSSSISLNTVELKPPVDKIIVKGDKIIPHIADLSYWAWPTERPYVITTGFGYRWGSMHAAIDVSGPGHGSDIYAANNGTVVAASSGCAVGNVSCNGRRGNYVTINHNIGGYTTTYMHMASINVKVGQVVSRGQKIGTMGNTGEVYPKPTSSSPYSGTHLHFVTARNGVAFNPYNLY